MDNPIWWAVAITRRMVMGMREKLIELLREVQYLGGLEEKIADHLIANGATIPVRCKECGCWAYIDEGFGDCTNRRFHLDGHADPTMHFDDFCSCGERRCQDAMQDQGDQGFNGNLP